MSDSVLVGVRVYAWQWFKFKKWAESQNIPPGEALTQAIKEFLSLQGIPQDKLDTWLAEYKGLHEVD